MDEKVKEKLINHFRRGGVLLNDTDNETWSHAVPADNKIKFFNGKDLIGVEFYDNIERARMLKKNVAQFFIGKQKIVIELA